MRCHKRSHHFEMTYQGLFMSRILQGCWTLKNMFQIVGGRWMKHFGFQCMTSSFLASEERADNISHFVMISVAFRMSTALSSWMWPFFPIAIIHCQFVMQLWGDYFQVQPFYYRKIRETWGLHILQEAMIIL